MANVRKLNSIEEYNEFINGTEKLPVIKFFGAWCGPCKVLAGILETLTDEEVEGVLLAEVDVDDDWFETVADGLAIRGIPTMFAYNNGEVKDRIVGLTTKDKIIDFFNRNK